MRNTTITRERIKRLRNRRVVFAPFLVSDLSALVDECEELRAQCLLRDVPPPLHKDPEIERLSKELEHEREQMFHAATVLSVASGLLNDWVKNSGGCDHDVGICCCAEKQVIGEAAIIYDQTMLAYTRRVEGEIHEG